jgi:hypothetical protein
LVALFRVAAEMNIEQEAERIARKVLKMEGVGCDNLVAQIKVGNCTMNQKHIWSVAVDCATIALEERTRRYDNAGAVEVRMHAQAGVIRAATVLFALHAPYQE